MLDKGTTGIDKRILSYDQQRLLNRGKSIAEAVSLKNAIICIPCGEESFAYIDEGGE